MASASAATAHDAPETGGATIAVGPAVGVGTVVPATGGVGEGPVGASGDAWMLATAEGVTFAGADPLFPD